MEDEDDINESDLPPEDYAKIVEIDKTITDKANEAKQVGLDAEDLSEIVAKECQEAGESETFITPLLMSQRDGVIRPDDDDDDDFWEQFEVKEKDAPVTRKRGRPPGAQNKAKTLWPKAALSDDEALDFGCFSQSFA